MNEERKMVYITKYALTTGVMFADVKICDVDMVEFKPSGSHPWYFYRKDFQYTAEEAIARVQEMKDKKLKSLEKSRKKVESIDPVDLVQRSMASE